MSAVTTRPAAASAPPMWRAFAQLRGVAILAVLVAHTGWLFHILALSNDRVTVWSPVPSLPFDFALPFWMPFQQLMGFCVPLFLFLSGHFLSTTKHTWKAIWNRIRPLAAAYLVWSLVGWAWSWKWGDAPWSVAEFLRKLALGETWHIYFFLALIFQWYVLARWVVPAVKARPAAMLAAAAVIQLAVAGYDYAMVLRTPELIHTATFPVIPRSSFLFCPLFPILGMAVGLHPKRFAPLFEQRTRWYVLLATLGIVFLLTEWSLWFHFARTGLGFDIATAYPLASIEWRLSFQLYGLVGILVSVHLARRWMPGGRAYNLVNANTFVLFLLNGPLMDFFAVFNWHIHLERILPSVILFVAVLLYQVVPPLVLKPIAQRLLGRYAYVLIGP